VAEGWVEVRFDVQKPQHGLRVDSFLAARLHSYSRAEVQKIVAAGRVLLRGRPAKAASRVASGEVVLVRYPKHDEPPVQVERLEVLYEDESLLAVDKPAGVLSHPTSKVVDNTVTSLLAKQRPGVVPRLAHRLDRETSGVLLLSNDAKTAGALYRLFLDRKVRKEYLAVVLGRVEWRSRLVDAPIGREGAEIRVRQAVGEGQSAVTEFELIEAGEVFSLVRARPRTGRLHQIRVHLASLGHPVAGDKLYIGGGESYMKAVRKELKEEDLSALGAARQLLHARRLTLPHPKDGRSLEITAPPPADFLALFPSAKKA
jgi:23S rRNA pseudouridine1911/1915/1917 synthase